jgi:hypothetical protein
MPLRETVVLTDVILKITFEAGRYRLRYGELVEYENGVRKIRGRRTRYAFRSVEQLRYDFERDVEAA